MGRRVRVQVTLELLPGAEPYLLVRHSKGWFKVPAWTEAGTLYEGALKGWQSAQRRARPGEPSVSVPLSVALGLGVGTPGRRH